ncbi:hypothetical protein [Candidatus Liberibacter sp.]|uniref:hypothetical protein n=1 Tax=Candidatus Liberibacter sp. TaxID=34022 RepID=UPI0015F6B9B6|nr:hypothetical protein [Candidatus Liberibacter sp.]MBA5724549.1 hypothetical protein [Candidatus Liberibacter sp.]
MSRHNVNRNRFSEERSFDLSVMSPPSSDDHRTVDEAFKVNQRIPHISVTDSLIPAEYRQAFNLSPLKLLMRSKSKGNIIFLPIQKIINI